MRRFAVVLILALLVLGGGILGTLGWPVARPLRHPPVIAAATLRLHPVRVLAREPARPRRTKFARARPGEPVPIELTAYCLSGTTRRGRYVRPGIVAADPRIFPLGRYVEVFVEGRYYGRFLVDDTGGKIKGPILDVWMASCDDAIEFGRRRGTAVLVPRR